MSCFMVINGSCSANMCARQLSFNFSSMVWGAWPRGLPFGSAPAIGIIHKIIGKDRACGSVNMPTDRQTHTETDKQTWSLRQPHSGTSSSISDSPIPSSVTSSSYDSPFCTSITPFLFHSRLKIYLFHKSYPLSFTCLLYTSPSPRDS